MRKLVVIYGSPGSHSYQIAQSLFVHPKCVGSNNITIQPTDINYYGPPDNTERLDELWELFSSKSSRLVGSEDDKYLVIEAPGYCFAYPYFSNLKGYSCKYIYTNRDPYEIIYDMVNDDMALSILDMDLVSTDCPRHRLKRWQNSWDELDNHSDEMKYSNRAMIRCIWHLQEIPPEMLSESLRIEYRNRENSGFIEKAVTKYLGINKSKKVLDRLSGFGKYVPLSLKDKDRLENLIWGGIKIELERCP